MIDQKTGSCKKEDLNSENNINPKFITAAFRDSNGKIRMSTPNDFFDFDESYQYTGIVKII